MLRANSIAGRVWWEAAVYSSLFMWHSCCYGRRRCQVDAIFNGLYWISVKVYVLSLSFWTSQFSKRPRWCWCVSFRSRDDDDDVDLCETTSSQYDLPNKLLYKHCTCETARWEVLQIFYSASAVTKTGLSTEVVLSKQWVPTAFTRLIINWGSVTNGG